MFTLRAPRSVHSENKIGRVATHLPLLMQGRCADKQAVFTLYKTKVDRVRDSVQCSTMDIGLYL